MAAPVQQDKPRKEKSGMLNDGHFNLRLPPQHNFERDPRHHGCHFNQEHITLRALLRRKTPPSIRALPESMIQVCHDRQVVQRFPR